MPSKTHRCVWIDILEQQTFGTHMPEVVKPKQCHLKMEDPRTKKPRISVGTYREAQFSDKNTKHIGPGMGQNRSHR